MGRSEAYNQHNFRHHLDIFWQIIICHYGVPQQIIINNTKYFDSAMFKDFCHKVWTKVSFASVYHLESNGAVE
jgi:hypothetical protein